MLNDECFSDLTGARKEGSNRGSRRSARGPRALRPSHASSGKRDDNLHLIRIGAFRSGRIHGRRGVVIRLTRLHRAVAEGHGRIQRRVDTRIGSCRRSGPVHVVSGNRRRRARVPRQVNCVLDRAARSAGSLSCAGRIAGKKCYVRRYRSRGLGSESHGKGDALTGS